MVKIAIFASGSGTNAEKIMEYFNQHPSIHVELVVSNRAKAGVLDRAKFFNVPTILVDRTTFYSSKTVLTELQQREIGYIVLAGFLWLIPPYLVQHFPKRMINIHPALLPDFGGKGMYGMHVHRAVKEAKVPFTGITIHFVNEQYDEGAVIFQAQCAVSPEDSPEMIARNVQTLEHKHYASQIEKLILS